jgi:alkanesulfonate monooxygenase SsuD/methylene tetrahydromethanopterin reductase-like flavin-dependent oxidoreductase (luciferase family)
MRISISLTNYSWPGQPATTRDALAATARAAESAGVDTIWVADHLLQADPASERHEPMLEAYTTLGYLAGQTEQVRLGTLVTAATFRAPALLIKQVTTLDVLSGGRAWLGIGVGYNTDEAAAMGLPLPATRHRYELLADTMEIAKRLWSGDDSPYRGRRSHLDRPVGSPVPISRPWPRLLIGGTGERRTLRLVAEHADACNLFDMPDGGVAVRRQLEALARHCADLGRPYDEVERTITTALPAREPAEQFVDRCRALAALGIQHVIVITRGAPWTEDALDPIAAAAAQLVAA